MVQAETSTAWAVVKLIVTLGIFAGVAYVFKVVTSAVSEGVDKTKGHLADQGIKFNKNGVAVKTDRRAVTAEETADNIQRGIMRGWKASSFQMPWALAKGSNLAGSSHDKNKAEWEAKHGGPKK